VNSFWSKRGLLSGHTGFKGAWAALCLERRGAAVTGIALPPEGEVNLYELLQPWSGLRSILLDIGESAELAQAAKEADPEIVIHMAAQALVRRSHRDPIGTFASNIMGTASLLRAIGALRGVGVVLVVTSDKVYDNKDQGRPFAEEEKSWRRSEEPVIPEKLRLALEHLGWRPKLAVDPSLCWIARRRGDDMREFSIDQISSTRRLPHDQFREFLALRCFFDRDSGGSRRDGGRQQLSARQQSRQARAAPPPRGKNVRCLLPRTGRQGAATGGDLPRPIRPNGLRMPAHIVARWWRAWVLARAAASARSFMP
jgi:hypothetical protein